ncbi:glycosyltransferase, partial [bacterium]|nr:glycosyltransferase [bacterium]
MLGITFIIPIFNTKIDYLEKCIKSVIKATSREDEIIIINDGSKKTISNYLDKYKNKISII